MISCKYPVLISSIAIRGIKKSEIARKMGISDRAFRSKLNGKTPFTWPEACTIQTEFFPDLSKDSLFSEESEQKTT